MQYLVHDFVAYRYTSVLLQLFDLYKNNDKLSLVNDKVSLEENETLDHYLKILVIQVQKNILTKHLIHLISNQL